MTDFTYPLPNRLDGAVLTAELRAVGIAATVWVNDQRRLVITAADGTVKATVDAVVAAHNPPPPPPDPDEEMRAAIAAASDVPSLKAALLRVPRSTVVPGHAQGGKK